MPADSIQIDITKSVKDALKKLDKTGKKVLLVTGGNDQLLGTVTDGDIRRYILSGRTLENGISEICNTNPLYIKQRDFSIKSAKKMLVENKIQLIPIVDEENKIVDFITWDRLFSDGEIEPLNAGKINIPVVIMAGGRGTRLDPFTRILPKPLIPIGDKPVIEIIIAEFKKQGVSEYYITLNHETDMVESYLNSIEKDYQIKFVKEDTFLGTAGSLKLLEEEISDIFIVSNCDVIVKADFEDVINFHKKYAASLTILASVQHYNIPYGVVKFKEGGEVINIHEKPEYTFTVNTGVYILSKESLQFIPDNSSFDMTDLINVLTRESRKVVLYPVNESDYTDIGQWEEYKKAAEKLRIFR